VLSTGSSYLVWVARRSLPATAPGPPAGVHCLVQVRPDTCCGCRSRG